MKTYLGRPWRDFAAVTFLNTEVSDVVRPVGWHNWDKPAREKTSRYAEFKSKGPGAQNEARARWSKQLSAAEARNITTAEVLGGVDGWNPKIRKSSHPPKTPKKSAAIAAIVAAAADRKAVRQNCASKFGIRKDLEYGRAGGESLRLDACVPDGSGPFPAVIMVHGAVGAAATRLRDLIRSSHLFREQAWRGSRLTIGWRRSIVIRPRSKTSKPRFAGESTRSGVQDRSTSSGATGA